MLYKTHLIFSLLVALILINYLNLKSNLIFVLLMLLFSFVPDLDIPNSKIGSKFKLVSFILNKIFSHRNFFHSILLPIMFYFIFYYIFELEEIALASFFGISSHLFLDLLTIEGLPLLAPFSNKRIKGFIRTGGFLEKIFFIILWVFFFIFLFKSTLKYL